jgi:hypothetical protein
LGCGERGEAGFAGSAECRVAGCGLRVGMSSLTAAGGSSMTKAVLILAVAVAGIGGGGRAWAQDGTGALRLDFGNGPAYPGWVKVGGAAGAAEYSDRRGYGFVGGPKLEWRDRERPDDVKRDYLFARVPSATFRIKVPRPGVYRLTVMTGDVEYGDHVLSTKVDVPGVEFPTVQPKAGEFVTMTGAFEVSKPTLDVTFGSPANNFVVNAVSLEPAEHAEGVRVERSVEGGGLKWDWTNVEQWPDPTAAVVGQFKRNLEGAGEVAATGLERGDYLKLIAGEVDFWKQHQDADGAIIDPYRKEEFQYSTPCFALAAAALVQYAGRGDLAEPAAKAMDWATLRLSQRKAATGHEDFYPPQLAHALPLLKGKVDAARYAQWEKNLRSFDPAKTYRTSGGNWNVVAVSGEWLFHQEGLRPDTRFIEQSLAGQARQFGHPWGLYTEGPMAYDQFPRMWAADMVAHGYDGALAKPLAEVLRRGAITSLFMESPAGELPTGGRSAHHQWNEAAEAVTFEIGCARAKGAGDVAMARAFKRGAHLALGSLLRWRRPSGEMQIVKNWVDPKEQFAYEGYSAHSQYNLLPAAMLVLAHEQAAKTENVAEGPAPADVGGYVLDVRERFNKVFANAGGTYVELDTAADPHYNATGLLRVHAKGVDPQIGPSDALTAEAVSKYPAASPRTTAAVGAAWKNAAGEWVRLAEFGSGKLPPAELRVEREEATHVRFDVRYTGLPKGGPGSVTEHYALAPGRVTQTSELTGYSGPVRLIVPLLVDDGREKSKVEVSGRTIALTLGGSTVSYTAAEAGKVSVEDALYPSRNGWYRLGVAEFPGGVSKAAWVIELKGGK